MKRRVGLRTHGICINPHHPVVVGEMVPHSGQLAPHRFVEILGLPMRSLQKESIRMQMSVAHAAIHMLLEESIVIAKVLVRATEVTRYHRNRLPWVLAACRIMLRLEAIMRQNGNRCGPHGDGDGDGNVNR